MLGAEHSELLEGGKLLLYTRDGIFQARVYRGNRRYLYRSLKTTNLKEARKLAVRFLHETEYKQQQGMALQQKTFAAVIAEYVAMRQQQYEQSLLTPATTSRKDQTSIHMLRQIKRVAKFWDEYCGKMAVERIDNGVMQQYVSWRKNFYHRMPANALPKNARLNPADKTLQWEVMQGKAFLKFAHERGYRGNAQLPTFSFVAQKKIVRPAFTFAEYTRLYKRLRRWITETDNEKWRYTRELLRDYVLILANSGMRVGEANNLRESDVTAFYDEYGHKNYRLDVRGKTGRRTVIPRTGVVKYVERVLARNAAWKERWETAKKAASNRKTEDRTAWFFRMADGNKVITLIDQFNLVLQSIGLTHNTNNEKFTLYSLRHFYATHALERGRLTIFDVASNMGARVEIIQEYYGSHAQNMRMAGRLGRG
jgi:integrase